MFAKRTLYMCMRSAECKADVRCSADDCKTAARILFACAVRDAMLQNEQNQPLFYSPRVDRARVLHNQKERLGANPKRSGKHRCVLARTTSKMAALENIPC